MNAKLEQILTSIVDEKNLYINQIKTAEEENEAWVRVATKNTITVNECKTIFAVLIKKYLTEKGKSHSTWKLYSMMEDLHLPKEALEDRDDDPIDEEDDALVELLEVHEEGDYETDEEEIHSKSFNSTNSTDNDAGQIDETKVEENSAAAPKQSVKILNMSSKSLTDTKNQTKRSQTVAYADLKLTLPTRNPNNSQKPISNTCPNILKSSRVASTQIKKINLNDNLKRKLISATRANEVLIPTKRQKSPEKTKPVVVSVPNVQSTASKLSHAIKQACISSTPSSSSSSSTPISKEIPQYTNNKKDASPPIKPKTSCPSDKPDENESKSSEAITSQNRINKPLVTITKINGVSAHNEDDNSRLEKKTAEVNLENGDDNPITAELNNWSDQLTPVLYKHLCNSKRFEAFGLYVCNVMNRLSPRLATNLERKVLKLIIEYTAEDIDT